jgi:catechol 2,3-dioxygenase-like lactoylglutathione lyase family enzyme
MTCMHPSETPPLGWLVPCLAVKDLQASLAFYAALDLHPYGGDAAEGWCMLRNRAVEVHVFQDHIPKDLLNFRGGDPAALRAAFAQRGLQIAREEGPRSFSLQDPDGREVFFDSGEEECAHYEQGAQLCALPPGQDAHAGSGLDLGNLACCLACEDLAATAAFYETLGLVPAGGERTQGWAVLGRRDHVTPFGTRSLETHVSLFQGMIPSDMLNLRGGNVGAIAGVLLERGLDLGEGVKTGPDGGESLLLSDPDGRPVFLDTTPPERLYEA